MNTQSALAIPMIEGSRWQLWYYATQESLRSALSSIRAHGMRSFLTMLGVIIGVASVICVVSLMQGLTQFVMSEFQGMGGTMLQVVPHTSTTDMMLGKMNRLRMTDLDEVRRRIAGISNITPWAVLGPQVGMTRSGMHTTTASVYATTPFYQLANRTYPKLGRFITDSDNDTRRRVVVLGEQARQDLKLPDDPLGQYLQIGNEWFKVVGVMEARGELFGMSMDNFMIVPYQTGVILAPPDNPPMLSIQLTVDDADAMDTTQNRLRSLLRHAHKLGPSDEDDFEVRSPQSLAGTIARISSVITAVVAAIVGISLLVGGVGIMNIMLVSVTERTREIGIAKALGAPRHYILMQFLLEAVLLSLVGGLIGIGCGYALSQLIAAMIPAFPPPLMPWAAVLGATAFSAFIGVVFGLLPARRAANLPPIEALRHE